MRHLLFLVALVGCASEPAADPTLTEPAAAPEPPELEAAPSKVEQAAAIATAIRQDPSRADAILAEHGTTRADFERTLYEITTDPELAAAYADALN